MSLWTTITNPTHCSWKHSRVLFPAFCKYSCGFRHKTTENLKPSLWLNSTEQILIVHGEVTGFLGERDLSLGGLLSPCTTIHIVLLLLSIRSWAGLQEQLVQFWPLRSITGVWWASLQSALPSTAIYSHINQPKHSRQLPSRSPGEYVTSTTFEERPPRDHAAAQLPSQLCSAERAEPPSFQPRAPPCHCLIHSASSPNALSAHVWERKKSNSLHAQPLQHSLVIPCCKKRNWETPACLAHT